MRTAYFLLVILCASNASAQHLDLVALKKELRNYIQVKSGNDWNAYTIKYLNADSLVIYEIPYNKDGEIEADIWGLAYYYQNYDNKRRNIESRYYDINGKLHFTDWPPVIKVSYDDKNNKSRSDYFDEDEKLLARFDYLYDKESREIEFRDYDKNLKLKEITRNEYRNDGTIEIKKHFDASDQLKSDESGVCMYYTAYENNKWERVIERRFLDQKENLVEVTDEIKK